MSDVNDASTIADLRDLARRRVPRLFFDYVESGSWSGQTFRENETDFSRIRLRQRVAVDVAERSLGTTILGQDIAMPIVLAPVVSAGFQIADGEIKAARAAEAAGIPFTLSMMSICSIEDVAAATTKPFWMHVYLFRDREFVASIIDRAKSARCPALVLTMDAHVPGLRHVDQRNGLTMPPKITPGILWQMVQRPRWCLGMLGTRRRTFGNIVGHAKGVTDLASLAAWIGTQLDSSLTWRDVAWVQERFDGRLIVKGILDPQDAKRAMETGADAIVVSNHGGRQLDGAPSSIRALPAIVETVGDRIEVLVDGGIRSGQDVMKAIALGAKAVLVGRPFIYGLGAGGEAGVSHALDIIRRELDATMALCGERSVQDIGRHNIHSNDLE